MTASIFDFDIKSWQDVFYVITIGGIGITAIYWIFKIILSINILFLLRRLDKASYRLYGRDTYLENKNNIPKDKRGLNKHMNNYFKDDNLSHVSSVIALWSDVFDFNREYWSLRIIMLKIKASPSSTKTISKRKTLYPYEYAEINKIEWRLANIKWKTNEIVFLNDKNEVSVLKITNDTFFRVSKKGRLKKIVPMNEKNLKDCIVVGTATKKELVDLLNETTTLLKN